MLSFQEYFVNEIMHYNFLRLLPQLSIVPWKINEVVACINSLFFFIAEQYSTVWLSHFLFNHSPVEGQLG
jgi:hypothetical protein